MTVRPHAAIDRVWLDVTSLLDRDSQPHGITRTLLNIFQEWRACRFKNLHFCRLHTRSKPAQNGYVEVHPDIVAARFQPLPEEEPDDLDATPTMPQRIISALRPTYHLLPKSLRRGLRWGGGRIRNGLRTARAQARRLLGQAASLLKRETPVPLISFSSTDLLVLAGLTWDRPECIQLHWDLKQQKGLRQAYLIYDLVPVFFPQYYGDGLGPLFAHWLADALWSADLIWVISEHTRRDLQEHLQECRLSSIPPIETIRLGEDLPQSGPARFPKGLRLGPNEPFVLCVGTLEFRKNHLLLYHVWHRLASRLGPSAVPKLVVVGRRGYLFENFHTLAERDPLTQDRIWFHPHATDAELRWLYQNCRFTMYPSHYEGWGLPIAESLAFGKYCIASDSSSMPEIGGPLVGYHDPLDVQRCLELVQEALGAEFLSRREDLIRRHYRRTTWKDSALRMIESLEAKFGTVFDREPIDVRVESAAA